MGLSLTDVYKRDSNGARPDLRRSVHLRRPRQACLSSRLMRRSAWDRRIPAHVHPERHQQRGDRRRGSGVRRGGPGSGHVEPGQSLGQQYLDQPVQHGAAVERGEGELGRRAAGAAALQRLFGRRDRRQLRRPGIPPARRCETLQNIIDKSLPAGFAADWTGQSYQEILAGNSATLLMVLSIVVVFLCLAALYESWSIPVAVLLVVPLGVLGMVAFCKCCRHAERHLFQDRTGHGDRPGRQERHPDRRVRGRRRRPAA